MTGSELLGDTRPDSPKVGEHACCALPTDPSTVL